MFFSDLIQIVKVENLLAHQEGHREIRATDDRHIKRMMKRDYIVRAISQRGETEEREKRKTEKEKMRGRKRRGQTERE